MLAAVGFALAVGRYDVGAYLWIEALFVVGDGPARRSCSSRRGCAAAAARRRPLLRRLRVERPLRAVYLAIHAFRDHVRAAARDVRADARRAGGAGARDLARRKAVGVDLSPRPYYVMGPLLFLVMLVPFTVNGLAVRESFFVSFLGTLGVDADRAFATGFLFFLVTIVLLGSRARVDPRLGGPPRHEPGRRVPRDADG